MERSFTIAKKSNNLKKNMAKMIIGTMSSGGKQQPEVRGNKTGTQSNVNSLLNTCIIKNCNRCNTSCLLNMTSFFVQ